MESAPTLQGSCRPFSVIPKVTGLEGGAGLRQPPKYPKSVYFEPKRQFHRLILSHRFILRSYLKICIRRCRTSRCAYLEVVPQDMHSTRSYVRICMFRGRTSRCASFEVMSQHILTLRLYPKIYISSCRTSTSTYLMLYLNIYVY